MPGQSKIPLNPIQQQAVEHPVNSPLKVIAGAGTGKTMVLTHRFVHILVKNPHILPQNILALTFTNKAAGEMKERIIALARDERLISRDDASPPQLWVGTFHSFCGRVLRENAFEAGLDPNFTVLSEADSRQIYHRIIGDFVALRLDTGTFEPEHCQYVRFDDPLFLYTALFTFISKLKDELISPDDFREISLRGTNSYYEKLDDLFGAALASSDVASATKKAMEKRRDVNIPYEMGYESEMIEVIYHIYRAYQDYLMRSDMLDFGDLIFKTYDLISSNEPIRNRYRERFKYILVDEFQDTNEAQFRLLCLLARDDRLSNVTVVGDDKQAIYGWRNARLENVDDFQADLWGGQSLNVSKNYRSYGEILEVAHYSIIQDEKFMIQSDSIKLSPERLGMAGEPRVMLYEAHSRQEEADFVAYEITELLKKGKSPDEIAILMRSIRAVKTYEDALQRAQIPYRTIGGTGFYDRQEIKDILAYLMVIDDPFDETAMTRVLKRPPVGLNDLSLYKLRVNKKSRLFDELNKAHEILDDGEAVRRIAEFLRLMERMWEAMNEGGVFHLITRLLEESGYLKYIYNMHADARERSLANVRKMLRMASEFEQKHIFSDLRDFVQYVQFSMDQSVIEGEAESGSGRKAVQIMTIHQAKGLEFGTVFIINARSPSFPTSARHPKFAMDNEDGLIINESNNGDKFLKYMPYDLKKNSHLYEKYGIRNHYEIFRSDHLGEERRIWYVAVTRAQHLLYISCPRTLGGRSRSSGPDFFEEVLNGFSEAKDICRIRSSEEDSKYISELPLWKGSEESVFSSIEEAEEYGKRLMEVLTSSWDNNKE